MACTLPLRCSKKMPGGHVQGGMPSCSNQSSRSVLAVGGVCSTQPSACVALQDNVFVTLVVSVQYQVR